MQTTSRAFAVNLVFTWSLVGLCLPAHANIYAYVANRDSDNVSVIDTATNTLFTTVQVGASPQGIALAPDSAVAYVTNRSSHNVSVIDTVRSSVRATVDVFAPNRVAITPDGALAYVTSGGNDVHVINTETNTVETAVAVGGSTVGVAVTPDGAFVYVTVTTPTGSVSVINTVTNEVEATVEVGYDPASVAITPAGTFAYVANELSGTVSVINTATNVVDVTIPVAGLPVQVAIAPNGSNAYVTLASSDNLAVINTLTYEVEVISGLGTSTNGVAITPDGEYAYVTNFWSDDVSVLDTRTNEVVATVAVGDAPVSIAITPVPISPERSFADVPDGYWASSFIRTLVESEIALGCGNGNFCPEASVTRAEMAIFLERGLRGSAYDPPAATGNVFLDVGAADFAAAFIELLFLDGITSGCGGNDYCPDDEVTRAQMAVFLLRVLHGSAYLPPPPTGMFNDVDLSHWAAAWIDQLAAEGITNGCGNGDYCPGAPVTRAQMAVFLVRAFAL